MNIIRGTKGITLIALVITIIILIILAGVAINLSLGENGIIKRAQEASKKQIEEQIKEEISTMLVEYAADKYTVDKKLIDYLNEQKDNGRLDEVKDNGDGTYTVEKGGYEITIKSEDLTILEIGEVGLGIKISNIQITTDGNTIVEEKSVKVGTPLQINFTHSIEGGTSTVTPSLPYTTNGTEMSKEFVVTGVVNGEKYTKTITISLEDKYKDQMIAETVQIGDFVNYSVGNWTQADIDKLGNLYEGSSKPQTANKFGGFGINRRKY